MLDRRSALQDLVRALFTSLLLVLALVGAPACRSAQRTGPASATTAPTLSSTVILIAIDGWRWDYHAKAALPHVQRLIDRGVRAESLIPAFPTKTFPNHYTIVTGLYPGHHGIVGNNMLEPSTGARFALSNRAAVQDAAWWGGEPLWLTATRQGRVAATQFWPGSEAPIGGLRPAEWAPYDESVTNDQRVDHLLGWLDRPPAARPVLLTTYFSDVDDAGHDFGPDSPELVAALQRIDAVIGRLLAGLDARGITDRVNVVVVSDHGMSPASRDRVIVLGDLLDLTTVDVVELNPNLGIVPKTTSIDEAYRRLSGAHPHLRVYRKEDTPIHWHFREHARVQPIVGVADEGWTIVRRPVAATAHFSLGHHGYDPQVPSMHGLFVACGPAFRRGVVVPAFENVHVYNVLARVLGIRPAPNDGDPRLAERLLSATRLAGVAH